MTTSIFIKTYKNDFEWLRYSLRSISKYGSGFDRLILACPESDLADLTGRILNDLSLSLPIDIVRTENETKKDGYLMQQVAKLNAYLYTDTDLILFTDSDVVFTRPFKPECFVIRGNPEIKMTKYTSLPEKVPWKKITERCLGINVEYEYMRRQPLVYKTESLRHFANWFLQTKGISLETYIMSRPYREFSEYNALGAWCHVFEPACYEFSDTETVPPSVDYCKQFWSWGGISEKTRQEIEEILK